MQNFIKFSICVILGTFFWANFCLPSEIKQETTGNQSPALYVSPGGSGTVNYDVSEESLSQLRQDIKKSVDEVRQSFLDCMQTVKEYQDKKIEEINIKFAEYVTAEKGVSNEKAKSWAKEIIEGTNDFKEFEKDNEKRKELLDEFNSQVSKGLVSNSYTVVAYILEIVDTSINDIINSDLDEKQNQNYEVNKNLNLFGKSTDDNKSFVTRSFIMAEGTLELWIRPGRFEDNNLVESCPALIFKVVGGRSEIKEFHITAGRRGGGGAIQSARGNLGYKKMEIVYPYDNMKYYPWKTDVLDEQFKSKFAENYKDFMKFALAVCRRN